jgi:hypothetical protein
MQAHAAWNHQFGLSSGELSRQIEKRGRYRDCWIHFSSIFHVLLVQMDLAILLELL